MNKRQNGGSDCAHPGRKYNAVLCAFEVCQSLLGDFGGRVAVSAVFVMRLALFGVILDCLAAFEGKCGGLHNRRHQRVGVFLPRLPRVNRPCRHRRPAPRRCSVW